MANTCILMGREAIWRFCILHKRASMVTLRKEKKIYIYIYIYTYVYQKCVDFYVVQCSVRRSRAQYVWEKTKSLYFHPYKHVS